MQSGDSFRDALRSQLSPPVPREDDDLPFIPLTRKMTVQESLSPGSTKIGYSQASSSKVNEHFTDVNNRQVSFLNNKRNPISEGPNSIKPKRGNAMERNDMHM